MDYEKAYKAVLKTATQWIKDGCTDKEKICLECVFPELKESEDERIRKEIRNFLIDMECKGEWISYLEKQKEQEPVEWSAYDKATVEYIIEDIKALRDEETDKEVIETYNRELNLLQCINDSIKLCNYTNPAEWSEEDEKIIQSLILEVDKYVCFAGIEANKIVSFLKSLRPQPRWKPTEKQMEVLLTAEGLVRANNYPEIAKILASLYEQLKN